MDKLALWIVLGLFVTWLAVSWWFQCGSRRGAVMSAPPDNGDMMAFPVQASETAGSLYAESGLSKREYIACRIYAAYAGGNDEVLARRAVNAADLLLAALAASGEVDAG